MRYLLAGLLALNLAAKPPQAQDCVVCHDHIKLDVFRRNTHGALACVDCHRAITALPHPGKLPPPRCERCHATEVENLAASVHGTAKARGVAHTPTCASCHGPAHQIVSRNKADSKVARANMAATCGACHPADFLGKLNTHLPRRTSRMGLQPKDVK